MHHRNVAKPACFKDWKVIFMGFFDFFKKNGDSRPTNIPKNPTKEDFYQMFMQQEAQRSPSDQFASGSVFDISRLYRDAFYFAASSNDVGSLYKLFVDSYYLFLDNPQVVGFTPAMVNINNNDTNPARWNVNIFSLQPGDYAALLFMPIQHDTLAARIVGIVFSDEGDGYYYCMLNKGSDIASDVIRNNALFGLEKVGAVRGLGFELMNSFLNCITQDYYQNN